MSSHRRSLRTLATAAGLAGLCLFVAIPTAAVGARSRRPTCHGAIRNYPQCIALRNGQGADLNPRQPWTSCHGQ